MIYQAYYAAPPGFKRWYNIRDTTNNNQMDWWSKTQIDLANEDAERTNFDQPLYVVPYKMDTRPGSTSYGQMLFEDFGRIRSRSFPIPLVAKRIGHRWSILPTPCHSR